MSLFKKKKKIADDALKAEHKCDTPVETEESASKWQKVKKSLKKIVVVNGKDSAINFAFKKIFGYILSAVLSAALVLFTQHSFKDNFKDYVKNFISVHIEEFSELVSHAEALESMDQAQAEQYCIENNIYEKSKNLLKVAISYTSDDKDINKLHTCFKAVCEDLLDLSVTLYTTSNIDTSGDDSEDVYSDVLALSDSIRGASANMNITYSSDGSPLPQEEIVENSESHNAMMRLKAKLEIFVELSNELCKKHKISPFI